MNKHKKRRPKTSLFAQLTTIASLLSACLVGWCYIQLNPHKYTTIPALNRINHTPTNSSSTASEPRAKNYAIALPENTLIEVRRDANLPNPYAHLTGCTDNSAHRDFPIILPPRFLENGYLWRRFYEVTDIDDDCHQLLMIGLPSNQHPDVIYDIQKAGRNYIQLTLREVGSEQKLYEQKLAVLRAPNQARLTEKVGIQPDGYYDELQAIFTPLAQAEKRSGSMIETAILRQNWAYYSSFRLDGTLHNERIVLQPETLRATDAAQTYHVGKGLVNLGSRHLIAPQAWQSPELLAISYLTTTTKRGESTETPSNKLNIIAFRRTNLMPLSCAGAVPLTESQLRLVKKQKIQHITYLLPPDFAQTHNCRQISIQVAFEDGQIAHQGVSES